MEAIFSRSNLKPDDGFLPYSLLEVFKKTGYGFTNIVVAQAGLKPVLHPEFFFFGSETGGPRPRCGALSIFLKKI